VGKESFDCHKVILSSASEFFERMFLSDFQESQSGKFRLSEVKPETFAEFLAYICVYLQQEGSGGETQLDDNGATYLWIHMACAFYSLRLYGYPQGQGSKYGDQRACRAFPVRPQRKQQEAYRHF